MFTRPIRFVVTLLMVGFSAVLAQAALPPPPPPPTTADVVYGQMGSFTTNTNNNGGRSANSAADPAGAAVDSSGNLYVGDTGNNRVLFYPAGTTTATRVYGQGQLHHRREQPRRAQRQQLKQSVRSRRGQQRQSLRGRLP